MRKLREVLRLRFELKLGYQQIGRSCAIGVSTVCKYLKRAEAAGLTWPLPEGWDDAQVEAALFPRSGPPASERTPARSKPDFVSKMGIVEEEADETMYWIELSVDAGITKKSRVDSLLEEADEIVSIVVSSIKTAKGIKLAWF